MLDDYDDSGDIASHCKNVYVIDAVQNIAQCKNKIIDKATELKANYLCIVEDDIILKDSTIANKYIEMMGTYDLGIAMYSFDNTNRAMGSPNPSLKIKLDEDGNHIWVARQSCSSFWVIDLSRAPILMFDEKSVLVESDIYLNCAADVKLIPFYGFYIDLPNSNQYFERLDAPTERIKGEEAVKADREYIGKVLKMNMAPAQSADAVIDYIRVKIGV
jgi:hypothetical protein